MPLEAICSDVNEIGNGFPVLLPILFPGSYLISEAHDRKLKCDQIHNVQILFSTTFSSVSNICLLLFQTLNNY